MHSEETKGNTWTCGGKANETQVRPIRAGTDNHSGGGRTKTRTQSPAADTDSKYDKMTKAFLRNLMESLSFLLSKNFVQSQTYMKEFSIHQHVWRGTSRWMN